jgi:hypothetical protein
MSPRIIHLPLSGRDRRHYVRELRAAEEAHRDLPAKVEEAYRAAHRLACQEWSVRQFIGGPAEPSPRIDDAIAGGCELLEVRCRRCSHESLIDLTEVVWPREKPVHTLANAMPSLQGRAEKAAAGSSSAAATTSRGRSARGKTARSTLIRLAHFCRPALSNRHA